MKNNMSYFIDDYHYNTLKPSLDTYSIVLRNKKKN